MITMMMKEMVGAAVLLGVATDTRVTLANEWSGKQAFYRKKPLT